MSDFDRNAATAQYGRPLTGAEAAVVDVGLRAYMLRIYNYMVIGLAITGFAALGVYLLSVTGDAGSAARSANGAAVALRNGVFLTPIGYALFVSPLKWLVILAPLGLVFFLSFRVESLRPATAQVLFWVYGAMVGDVMERSAIMGALSLYLDFLNLFTMLLSLLGTREE